MLSLSVIKQTEYHKNHIYIKISYRVLRVTHRGLVLFKETSRSKIDIVVKEQLNIYVFLESRAPMGLAEVEILSLDTISQKNSFKVLGP